MAARLRIAAMGANQAQSHAEPREAAGDLAAAQQMVGLDRWSAFVADASQRVSDPATIAAIEKSEQPPDPRKDAITPVYPLERLAVIAATAMTGGVAAGLRAAGGAILRQMKPSGAAPKIDLLPNAPKARIPHDKITGYALNAAHKSGGDKARVFEAALGINRSNVESLISQIRNGVMKYPAQLRYVDRHGQHFAVDIPMTGPKGSAVVRTGWVI